MIRDPGRQLLDKLADLAVVQRTGLAFDAIEGLHRVAVRKAAGQRPQPVQRGSILILTPPEPFVLDKPVKNSGEAPDAMERQAKRRHPFLQELVRPIGEAVEHVFDRFQSEIVRHPQHAGRVLERPERGVAANVVDDAFYIQRVGREAGPVVKQRDRQAFHPAAEVALLQQRPRHVGTPGRPAVDGRRGIGGQPQGLDVEHEGIAAALKTAAERRQGIDVLAHGKRPEDLLPGQYPLRRTGHAPERFAHGLAGRRGGDPERRFQPVGLVAGQVVVVVVPSGSQFGVFQAAVRQRRPGIQRRQPSQGCGKVHELNPNGRRERQRRSSGIGADGDVDAARRVELAKLAQHRREPSGPPAQPAFLVHDEGIQPHVVVDDPDDRTRPAAREGVQIGLQYRPGGGDGQPASPDSAPVGNQAACGVFEMPSPIHQVDPQANRALARYEFAQRFVGCPTRAVLQDQHVMTGQPGLFGKLPKIGKQIADLIEPRRVGDHTNDQVG